MKMHGAVQEQDEMHEQYIADAMHQINTGASHSVVGRTQRLVKERVRNSEMQRRSLRSLWLPLLVCSAMVVMLAHSAWTVVGQWSSLMTDSKEGFSFAANSTPLLILTLWFMPMTMGVLVMIWFQRSRKR